MSILRPRTLAVLAGALVTALFVAFVALMLQWEAGHRAQCDHLGLVAVERSGGGFVCVEGITP